MTPPGRRLPLQYDAHGRPILHGLARVQELGLAVDLAAGLLGDPAQADQRRPPDGFDKAVANVHVCSCLAWRPKVVVVRSAD
jgi:hypothetical protein